MAGITIFQGDNGKPLKLNVALDNGSNEDFTGLSSFTMTMKSKSTSVETTDTNIALVTGSPAQVAWTMPDNFVAQLDVFDITLTAILATGKPWSYGPLSLKIIAK